MEVLMETIRLRQTSITERTEESVRLGVEQMDNGFKRIKEIMTMILETGLRLPGLLLLELLWRYQGLSFDDIPDNMMNRAPLSYFDIPTMLDFVHRRDFDHYAAVILSYFVIFISLMFLTLPLKRLLPIYINLEIKSEEEELKLDALIKLERHGFHFLSQMLLAVLQSLVLEMDTDPWRIALPIFALPIVTRMCGCPRDKLKNAHNYACTGIMIFIATYILNRAPAIIKSMKTALRQMRALFFVRGLADGAIVVWRKLRIVELMAFTWITMFLMVLYVELIDKGRTWSEVGRVLLSGVAETTNTPLTLLALAISVSYVCKWIADITKMITGGTRSHGHVLAHSGYTEAFSVFILLDIWTAIIIANNVTVSAHAIGLIFKYTVLEVETKSEEPWERSDDFVYYIECVNKGIEILSAICVMLFGCMQVVKKGFSCATLAILLFHVVVNIYKRLENFFNYVRSRNAAVNNINQLKKADTTQLKEREDLCAICFIEMREEARITPCKHYFHGPCLRKWLAVKMVCPLCYSEMREDVMWKIPAVPIINETTLHNTESMNSRENVSNQRPVSESDINNRRRRTNDDVLDWDDLFGFRMDREIRNRDEQRLHGARDMWPLLVDNDEYESDTSNASELSSTYGKHEQATKEHGFLLFVLHSSAVFSTPPSAHKGKLKTHLLLQRAG
ncbi:unnamed protein product [Caenorhabditis sp. 36 PRJEB53466]|nr:unnamed protein product [Caenorhabditis sp. 36 PRJEB53466]